MSSINVSNLAGPSGTGTAATLASINGGPISGARNRIINGDMRIDQRNAGASVTVGVASAWITDRFKADCTVASKVSMQQVTTAPAGFNNSLLATSLSAYSVAASDFFLIGQIIEGFNISDLDWGLATAKPVTLSFWTRSSLTGTFSGAVENSAGNRCYVFSYSVNSANTWEYKTVTIPGDTSGAWLTTNTIGMAIRWNLGSGSTFTGSSGSWGASRLFGATGSVSLVGTNGATFYLTGVQLEAGTVATPFERRSYGQELALCQRYCYTFTGSTKPLGSAFVRSTQKIIANVVFPVTMRSTPTLTSSNSSGHFNVSIGGNDYNFSTLSPAGGSVQSDSQYALSNSDLLSGLTLGDAGLLHTYNASAFAVFSAEL